MTTVSMTMAVICVLHTIWMNEIAEYELNAIVFTLNQTKRIKYRDDLPVELSDKLMFCPRTLYGFQRVHIVAFIL